MASTGSCGTAVGRSATISPSTVMVRCPTPAAPSRYGPVQSGRKLACRTTLPPSPQPMPGGTPSHHARVVAVRCSVRSTAPSAATNSRCTPRLTGHRIAQRARGRLRHGRPDLAALGDRDGAAFWPAIRAMQRLGWRGKGGGSDNRAAAALDRRPDRARPEHGEPGDGFARAAGAHHRRCAAARTTRPSPGATAPDPRRIDAADGVSSGRTVSAAGPSSSPRPCTGSAS